MLKKPSVNHVSEHLSMMSPVYTKGEVDPELDQFIYFPVIFIEK